MNDISDRFRFSTRARRCPLLLWAVPLAFGSPLEVMAQNAPEGRRAQLEEILVTASRREEGLQSVATSIAAVTAEELDKQGITGFLQVAESVSGLELKQHRGLISSGIYIRGVGTSGSTPADPSVGVVIDGVYQQSIGSAFTELLDIERVEVLRGPQGTLFGKNTTAGVIRIITEKPDTTQMSARLQGVYGNLDNQELRGLINLPLVEGRLGLRVSGYSAERDGYTRNVYADEDTRNIDRHGWRGKLLWNITDSFEAQLTAERHRQSARMDTGLAEYPDSLLSRFGDVLPPIGVGRSQQSPERTSEDISRYILNLSWDLGAHSINLTSSYEEIDDFLSTDQDGTVLEGELGTSTITYIESTAEREVTTHELQLTSNFEGAWNYILGGFWQNVDRSSHVDIFVGPGIPVNRPPSLDDFTSKAVFANVNYDFDERWSMSVGGRYSEDEAVGGNNYFAGKVQFDEWTYSLKLSYQLDADKMLYVSHDKGFKSGGINRELNLCGRGGPCVSASQAFWDPEITYNYEIGLKSEWLDRRLRLNAALFHQVYEDFQVNQTLPGDSGVLLTNAAEVHSTGLEADFTWVASANFTLSGSVAWMATEYDSYTGAPCALPTSPRCVDGAQEMSGRILDNAPRLTYTLAGEYRNFLSQRSGIEWFGRLDTSYKSEHYLHVMQPAEAHQGSYHIINARLGIENPDRWRLTLWGRNLADKEYLVHAELAPRGLRKVPGLERTYGLTLDWFF